MQGPVASRDVPLFTWQRGVHTAVHSGVLFSSVCLLHVTQKIKTLILRLEATRQKLRVIGPEL